MVARTLFNLVLLLTACQVHAAPRRGLIIHSFSLKTPWVKEIERGLKEELGRVKEPITWKSISLSDSSVAEIRRALAQEKPSLVILNDDQVCRDFMPELMAQKMPTFFTGVVDPTPGYLKPDYKKFQTGVFETLNFLPVLSVIKLLGTPIKKIAIVGGASYASTLVSAQARAQIKEFDPTISVEVVHTNDFSEWKKEIKRLSPTVQVLIPLLPFEVTECGKTVPWAEFNRVIRAEVKIPTIGIAGVKGPIERLAANAIDPAMMGRQTAMLVQRYLGGEPM